MWRGRCGRGDQGRAPGAAPPWLAPAEPGALGPRLPSFCAVCPAENSKPVFLKSISLAPRDFLASFLVGSLRWAEGGRRNACSDRQTPRDQSISFSGKEKKPSQDPHTSTTLYCFLCKYLTLPEVHPSGQAWGVWATARRQKTRASMKKNDARPTRRLRSSCRRSVWLTKRLTACCYWVRPEGARRLPAGAERTARSAASAGAGRAGPGGGRPHRRQPPGPAPPVASWRVLENAHAGVE